jgi:hypothetical protein
VSLGGSQPEQGRPTVTAKFTVVGTAELPK